VSTRIDVSVLMATYRRPAILQRTLQSFTELDTGDISWELVIADNAGDPETRAIVEGFKDRLPVKLLVEPRQGKNHALNAAIEVARGELFVFADDDVIVDQRWLLEITAGAARWPGHSIFGGRIVPRFPRPEPAYDLRDRNIIQAFAIADWQQGEGEIPVVQVYGPNMAMRRTLFADGRRFDVSICSPERRFMMADESSFLLEMGALGHAAIYLPGALVHHQVRPEQMQLAWLKDRAFRSGRTIAVHEQALRPRMFLGLPRYVFSELLWSLAWAGWCKIRGEHARALSFYLSYCHWRGQYHQYSITRRAPA
jgi:glycosyltransferase involved in cell wall biosynthesis